MPFKKFRPIKQFGRFNTRLFRSILRKRNNSEFTAPDIQMEIQRNLNVVVHNPLDPGFFKQFDEQRQQIYARPEQIYKRKKEQHPLHKELQCFLFEGTNSLTDGVDQACALINALKPLNLPEKLLSKAVSPNFLTADFENHVIDCIMAGECFDPTLEPLPKKFDPILFWIKQKKFWGTPVLKRNNIILRNLCMKVLMLSMRDESKQFGDVRSDYDAPISSFLPTTNTGIGAPLVFRHQPHIVLQRGDAISPLADRKTVAETISSNVPNIYPISPLIDLDQSNIYNDGPIIPRMRHPDLYINTILWSREQNQKYPWTMEENAANTICHCFGAALAQALRRTPTDEGWNEDDDKILPTPILAKAVQLVNGKLDLAMVQLNTLNLANKRGIKNLVWLNKACSLYKPKPMHENMKEVEGLNMETVHKFIGLLLYR